MDRLIKKKKRVMDVFGENKGTISGATLELSPAVVPDTVR